MTRENEVLAASQVQDSGISKRTFLKTAAILGAGAAVSSNRAFAADKDTLRIGYISPKTGPFAPFAEADQNVLPDENAGPE